MVRPAWWATPWWSSGPPEGFWPPTSSCGFHFFIKIDVLKILKLFDLRKIWVSNFPELDTNIMVLARKPSKSLKTMVVTPNMWDIYIIKFKIHRYISDVSDT
jgi:hypothetical protein